MDKLLKLWYEKLRPKFIYLMIITIIISILIDNKSCYINYILLSVCSLFLFLYAYTFRKSDGRFVKYRLCIMVLSMIVCGINLASIHNNLFLFIFYFMMVDDIFDNCKSQKIKLIILHFFICMLSMLIKSTFFRKASLNDSLETLFYMCVFYALILFVFIVVHKNKQERDELKILNCKLLEYSFKERDYLISEERSRVSQELHDSLGHLLMALSMNVQYAKALEDKDKIKEELSEVAALVEESIKTLRSTVYNLKELDENFNLYEELKRLIAKLNSLTIVKINLDYDNRIENTSGIIKNILLVTIKEAITNSLTHGSASVINITSKIQNSVISLEISDNGFGCKIIKKSTGLSGVSNRFEKVNGRVSFDSKENNGFVIKASIPINIQEGGFINDKGHDS